MEIENQELEINMQGEPYIRIINGKVDSVNGMTGDVVLDASDVNALPDSTLYGASLVLTIDSSTYVLTGELKDQNGDTLGVIQSIDLPLESMVVGGEYDESTKSIILTLKNGQTVSFSVADLVSGLQTEITPSNKLSSDLVDDTGHTNKFITQAQLDKLNAIVEIKSIGAGLTLSSSGELSADSGDFFTASESVSALGTNITMTNTLPVAIKSVEFDGDTTQQTYSGKNLFGAGTIASTSYCTATISNNIITVTPTGTGNPQIRLALLKEIPAGTYTLNSSTYLSVATILGTSSNTTVYNFGANYQEVNFTSTDTASRITFNFANPNNTNPFTINLTTLQIEAGSTATSYEPYVGGIPAPNPDYPQDVNVVTGAQTVKLQGKNLWNPTPYQASHFISATGVESANPSVDTWGNIYAAANTTFTMQATFSTSGRCRIHAFSLNGTWMQQLAEPSCTANTQMVETFTTPNQPCLIRWCCYKNPKMAQLELNSGATTYEPYQSQTYTVDLGSTELCKIGTYQDYIYKSGDDWYVHKAIGKVTFTGAEENWATGLSGDYRYFMIPFSDIVADRAKMVYSNNFKYYSGNEVNGVWGTNNGRIVIFSPESGGSLVASTISDFKTWLSTNNTLVYYALATPTDTQITDASLISDLNALAGASTYTDLTYITSTATGTNLPVILDIEAYRKSLAGIIANL